MTHLSYGPGWFPIAGGPMNDCEFYVPAELPHGTRLNVIPPSLKADCVPGYYTLGHARIIWNSLDTAPPRR